MAPPEMPPGSEAEWHWLTYTLRQECGACQERRAFRDLCSKCREIAKRLIFTRRIHPEAVPTRRKEDEHGTD